jgi:MYXO-CTERM domain-containing protein
MHRPARNAAVLFSIAVVLVVPQFVAAQPLPEGDTGIAAQYPNDVGIGGDPAVVFHEDFEGVTGGTITSGGSAFDAVYGDNSITQQPANVHGGVQAVERIHASPGSFGGVKYLGTGYDTVHLRYYMKYHAQFPGCHHTGGGLYAAAGSGYVQIGDITGVRPDGTNHFQAYLDDMAPFFSWNPPGNDTPPGWLNIYCYNMDQGSQWGDLFFPDGMILPGASGVDFGTEFTARPNFVPERDRWYSFEIMMQANTPGQSDGRIAIWVDGRLTGDFPNLQLRSTDSLKVNHLAISTYSSEIHPNKTLWYDDVVAATSYIGPMVTDGPVDTDGGVPTADGAVNGQDGSVVDNDGGNTGGQGDGGCGCNAGNGPSTPAFWFLFLLCVPVLFRLRRTR